jgi:hypothetical protein
MPFETNSPINRPRGHKSAGRRTSSIRGGRGLSGLRQNGYGGMVGRLAEPNLPMANLCGPGGVARQIAGTNDIHCVY